MSSTRGFAARQAGAPLQAFDFERRAPRAHDVVIEILYCGVCHTDLHQVRDDWHRGHFPMVPGHEIIGRVTATGTGVKNFHAGDSVGVGCMVDSCRACASCEEGQEQFCENGFTPTYSGFDRIDQTPTYGGYSTQIVVDEAFVLHVRRKDNLAGVAPLLCAGITTYSPLRHWHVGPGQRVGIVGLGGLGHMGVKITHALGAHVVLFTTSPGKEADARRLGADEVVISRDAAQMEAQANRFDFILDTVAAAHDINAYTALLRRDGTLTLLGLPPSPPSLVAGNLVHHRRQIAGSLIGGIRETQAMLDFCADHGLWADIELISMKQINVAYERMLKSDVKYRFVIDMSSLKTP